MWSRDQCHVKAFASAGWADFQKAPEQIADLQHTPLCFDFFDQLASFKQAPARHAGERSGFSRLARLKPGWGRMLRDLWLTGSKRET
jgi:hypothetical protein